MTDTERLAALLRDEYELSDYWVSKSRLADAAYRGRDPMDDWRGLAARLVAAGVRVGSLHSDPLMEARCDGHCAADECVCPIPLIDPERLARAMSKVAYPDPEDAWPTTVKDVKDLYRHQAHAIVKAYEEEE